MKAAGAAINASTACPPHAIGARSAEPIRFHAHVINQDTDAALSASNAIRFAARRITRTEFHHPGCWTIRRCCLRSPSRPRLRRLRNRLRMDRVISGKWWLRVGSKNRLRSLENTATKGFGYFQGRSAHEHVRPTLAIFDFRFSIAELNGGWVHRRDTETQRTQRSGAKGEGRRAEEL